MSYFDGVWIYVIIGALIGAAFGILAFLKAKRGSHIAFGPHLCFGVAAALYFGADVLAWYIGMVF